MIQKLKFVGLAAGIILAGALGASAATFKINGGTAITLSDPATPPAKNVYDLLEPGLPFTVMSSGLNPDASAPNSTIGFGLELLKAKKLRFTYIGSEAGLDNASYALGSTFLFDNFGAPNTDVVLAPALGDLGLKFTSFGNTVRSIQTETAVNAVGLRMGLMLNGGGNVAYVFFDDRGAGQDLDYDDLAYKISAVPLPAGGLLLISGLGLLAAARRRKQA